MTKLIVAKNISKVFHDGDNQLQILHELNFNLERGEKVAILGASGSGKSTLLHILAGLDKPTTGQVYIEDTKLDDLNESSLAALRNKKLGFIYQFHHLLPEFTALENVAMPLLIRGVSFDKALSEAKQCLKKIKLSERIDFKPAKLSGGERQRVAIARSLISKPKCILADEPTGNLDENNAKNVFNLLLDINRESQTGFILVTHDVELAKKLDTIYVLNQGRLSNF